MGLGLTEAVRGGHRRHLTTVRLRVCVYPLAPLSRCLSVASEGIGFLSLRTTQACVLSKVAPVSAVARKPWGRKGKACGEH